MDKRKLQRLIDNATKAHNAVHKADAAIHNYCHEVWQFNEFDDSIIDGCLGGCGHSNGMTADEFIKVMSGE